MKTIFKLMLLSFTGRLSSLSLRRVAFCLVAGTTQSIIVGLVSFN